MLSPIVTRSIKLIVAAALLGTAGVLTVSRWRAAMGNGETDAQVFFYDESEKRLYTAARDQVPPHIGIGGAEKDGVRAVVVAPKNSPRDSRLYRIAYLETYAPPLKLRLEAVRAARQQGRGADVKGPKGDDPFVAKNTLVRTLDKATWHDMTTPDARAIVSQWMGWKAVNGDPLVIVLP